MPRSGGRVARRLPTHRRGRERYAEQGAVAADYRARVVSAPVSAFAGAQTPKDMSGKNVSRGGTERQSGDGAHGLTNNGNTGAQF